MNRQDDWINQAMNSAEGLKNNLPSADLRAKTIQKMKEAASEKSISMPVFWAVAASLTFFICVNVGVSIYSSNLNSTDLQLAETNWFSQTIDLDINE